MKWRNHRITSVILTLSVSIGCANRQEASRSGGLPVVPGPRVQTDPIPEGFTPAAGLRNFRSVSAALAVVTGVATPSSSTKTEFNSAISVLSSDGDASAFSSAQGMKLVELGAYFVNQQIDNHGTAADPMFQGLNFKTGTPTNLTPVVLTALVDAMAHQYLQRAALEVEQTAAKTLVAIVANDPKTTAVETTDRAPGTSLPLSSPAKTVPAQQLRNAVLAVAVGILSSPDFYENK